MFLTISNYLRLLELLIQQKMLIHSILLYCIVYTHIKTPQNFHIAYVVVKRKVEFYFKFKIWERVYWTKLQYIQSQYRDHVLQSSETWSLRWNLKFPETPSLYSILNCQWLLYVQYCKCTALHILYTVYCTIVDFLPKYCQGNQFLQYVFTT